MIKFRNRDITPATTCGARLPRDGFGSGLQDNEIERAAEGLGDAIATDLVSPDTPWVKVWMAVIIQALKDATRNTDLEKQENRERALFTSLEAKDWLFDGGEDFQEVCDLANVDAGAVRSRARDIVSGKVEFNRRVDPVESAKRRRLTLTSE